MAEIVCQMSEKYEEYLIDESKYKGYADSISFPESEEEIVTILEKMRRADSGDDTGSKNRDHRSRHSDGRPYLKPLSYE